MVKLKVEELEESNENVVLNIDKNIKSPKKVKMTKEEKDYISRKNFSNAFNPMGSIKKRNTIILAVIAFASILLWWFLVTAFEI